MGGKERESEITQSPCLLVRLNRSAPLGISVVGDFLIKENVEAQEL